MKAKVEETKTREKSATRRDPKLVVSDIDKSISRITLGVVHRSGNYLQACFISMRPSSDQECVPVA